MPHAKVALAPGVNTNETPTLNEAAVSTCNLVRYTYDPRLGALIEPIGGWTKFYPNTTASIVRAMWAWEDTQSKSHLGIGTQNIGNTYQAQLAVITGGNLKDITPTVASDNETPDVETFVGDPFVVISDSTLTNITFYDAVYIPAHISIGGIILFGLYACDPDGFLSATSYTVQSVDTLGRSLPPTANSTTATVADYETTTGVSSVTVTLANHGYNVGSTYPVLIKTEVGGITLYGNYRVQSVTDADTFIILGDTEATASTTGQINGGKARYIYQYGVGAIPAGTGYGIGGYGLGGYGTGTAVAPIAVGTPISAVDWTIDNWGSIQLACPIASPIVLTVTAATGDGTTGTVTFAEPYTVTVGETVAISGVIPSEWNGRWVIDTATSGSVTFATTNTNPLTGAGAATVETTTFQPIYAWDSESGSPTATAIAQGPSVNDGMFVAMPQRQIVAWGSTFTGVADPLLVRWCDVNNFNVWLGTATNQAGSYRLPKGSRIMGGIQGPQQGLLWTDLGVWAMQYIGPPYVYSFNEIGNGCGMIARKAAASLNDEIYWMGPSQFYVVNGDGVQILPCSVWDAVFQNLNQNQLTKIRVAVNSRFNEIGWFYPSAGSDEVDSYIKYNALLKAWDYGSLARSAWVDQSVLGPPVGADPNTIYLQQHETSPDADGAPLLATFRTGYYAMNEGDDITYVDQMWPDMKWGYFSSQPTATVRMTFHVADYPNDVAKTYGPYTLTSSVKFISPRFRGRLVSIEISNQDVGSFWRIGGNRYRFSQDGKF